METIRALPQVGKTYEHNIKRTPYRVIAIANSRATDPCKWPLLVVYEDKNGHVWSRPVHEFLNKCTVASNKSSLAP